MLNAQKLAQYITRDSSDSALLHINIADKQYEVGGALVESITMYVATAQEDGDYYDGDLAVNWSTAGLRNNVAARTMGTLALRDVYSDDDVTEIMQLFYWQHDFDAELRSILHDVGFSKTAANSVTTSEWGMQDEGRASYDACDIAEEVRKVLGI